MNFEIVGRWTDVSEEGVFTTLAVHEDESDVALNFLEEKGKNVVDTHHFANGIFEIVFEGEDE